MDFRVIDLRGFVQEKDILMECLLIGRKIFKDGPAPTLSAFRFPHARRTLLKGRGGRGDIPYFLRSPEPKVKCARFSVLPVEVLQLSKRIFRAC